MVLSGCSCSCCYSALNSGPCTHLSFAVGRGPRIPGAECRVPAADFCQEA
ncbi:SWIM zinc finger family protein [Paraburkholderia humisilvae]